MLQTDRNIWKVEEADAAVANLDSGNNLTPGWYFQNEVEQLVGPYSSRQEALDALDVYAKQL